MLHRVRHDSSDLACTHTYRNYRSFQVKVKGEFVELSFPNRTNDRITATTRINRQQAKLVFRVSDKWERPER